MAQQEEIRLTVCGMTCDEYGQHTTKALESVSDVQAVQAPDWKLAQATAVADGRLDEQALVAALDATGYGATIKERHLPEEAKTAEFSLEAEAPPGVESCCIATAGSAAIQIATARPAGFCPDCGQKGKSVDHLTVKAMLSVSLTEVRPVSYLFCLTADCQVVYFSEHGEQTFTTADVRERVHQKEPEADDVLVCYCFRHTAASIRADWMATGHSTILDSINASIQAGQCACDLRNPHGSCCLGNVRAVVKQVEESTAKTQGWTSG